MAFSPLRCTVLDNIIDKGWYGDAAYKATDIDDNGKKYPAIISDFRAGKYAQTPKSTGDIASQPASDIRAGECLFSDIYDFTRGSNAYYCDEAGEYRVAANDVPRFDHTNGRHQLLLEGGSTNFIRNNSFAGAVVGTIGSGGSLPTNGWSIFAANGLAMQIVSVRVEQGREILRIRLSGTASAGFYVLAYDNPGAPANPGEVWTQSVSAAKPDGIGSLNGIISVNNSIRQTGGSGATTDVSFGTLTSTLVRKIASRTMLTGTTAVVPALYIQMTPGAAIDFTFDLTQPQLEIGSRASSVIRTAGATASRSADNCRFKSRGIAVSQRAAASLLLRGQAITGNGTRLVGAASSNCLLGFNGGSTFMVLGTTTNILTVSGITVPLPSFGAAVGWNAAGKAGSYNGGAPASNAFALDTTLGDLYLGRDAAGNFSEGWYDEIIAWPFRMINNELQTRAVAYA